MSEIVQLYGELLGLPIRQADTDSQDSEAEPELRCPNCECQTLALEKCIYCNFDLFKWAKNMQQSKLLSETLDELKNENGGMKNE